MIVKFQLTGVSTLPIVVAVNTIHVTRVYPIGEGATELTMIDGEKIAVIGNFEMTVDILRTGRAR